MRSRVSGAAQARRPAAQAPASPGPLPHDGPFKGAGIHYHPRPRAVLPARRRAFERGTFLARSSDRGERSPAATRGAEGGPGPGVPGPRRQLLPQMPQKIRGGALPGAPLLLNIGQPTSYRAGTRPAPAPAWHSAIYRTAAQTRGDNTGALPLYPPPPSVRAEGLIALLP